MKHANIAISGLVQGVFFRYNVKTKADELNIYGWARNGADGKVYLEAEGEEKNLDKFIDFCRQSPGASRVEKVDCDLSSSIKGFNDFYIY